MRVVPGKVSYVEQIEIDLHVSVKLTKLVEKVISNLDLLVLKLTEPFWLYDDHHIRLVWKCFNRHSKRILKDEWHNARILSEESFVVDLILADCARP